MDSTTRPEFPGSDTNPMPAPGPTGTVGELPPIEPPSARFIMQLFVVPFLIVLVLVGFLLLVYTLFGRLATGGKDPGGYIQAIRSGNENRRWRAAYELASLIHNDASLVKNRDLLGELTRLFREELDRPEGLGAGTQEGPRVAQYLALTLGSFETLDARGAADSSDPIAALVDALGPSRPATVRAAAATSLSRQLARLNGEIDSSAVAPALIRAASADEPAVRADSVYALGYLDSAESATALERALRDPERGVRYNAAAALARRDEGDDRAVLREMLSTPDLEAVYDSDLRERPDEAREQIAAVQLEAIRSLQAAASEGRTRLTEGLRPDLKRLAASGPKPIAIEARELLQSLQKSH